MRYKKIRVWNKVDTSRATLSLIGGLFTWLIVVVATEPEKIDLMPISDQVYIAMGTGFLFFVCFAFWLGIAKLQSSEVYYEKVKR